MSKKKGGLCPTVAALLLSAIVGVSGQAPGSAPIVGGESSVSAETSIPSTRTTPTPGPLAQQVQQAIIDGDGRKRRYVATNPKRAARRLLERAGYITSGRDWRRFMKMTHHDAVAKNLFHRALAFVTS